MPQTDTTCDECDSNLVQLGGDWHCPECDETPGESFRLDSEDPDFAL